METTTSKNGGGWDQERINNHERDGDTNTLLKMRQKMERRRNPNARKGTYSHAMVVDENCHVHRSPDPSDSEDRAAILELARRALDLTMSLANSAHVQYEQAEKPTFGDEHMNASLALKIARVSLFVLRRWMCLCGTLCKVSGP